MDDDCRSKYAVTSDLPAQSAASHEILVANSGTIASFSYAGRTASIINRTCIKDNKTDE